MKNKSQIIIYKTEDGHTKIDVQFDGDTVWLNQNEMALLYDKGRSTITEHISNVFKEKELIEKHFENEEREISLLLIECFDKEKEEGELNRDFEERLLKEVMENLNLKSIWEDVN